MVSDFLIAFASDGRNVAAAAACLLGGAGAGALAMGARMRSARPARSELRRVDPDEALVGAVDAELGGARVVGRSRAGAVAALGATGYSMVRLLREAPELEGVPLDQEALAALDALPLFLSKSRDECLAIGFSTCRCDGDGVAFAIGRKSVVASLGGDRLLAFPKAGSGVTLTEHGGLILSPPEAGLSPVFLPRVAWISSEPAESVLGRYSRVPREAAESLLRQRQVRLLTARVGRPAAGLAQPSVVPPPPPRA